MWLSGEARRREETPSGAQAGYTTLGGDGGAVYLDGERRAVAVYGPGGYQWSPAPGQEVLVLKNGGAGAAYCVAAARTAEGCAPGEVRISAPGGAAVHLTADGAVELTGRVLVNGVAIEDMIRQFVGAAVGGADGTDGT